MAWMWVRRVSLHDKVPGTIEPLVERVLVEADSSDMAAQIAGKPGWVVNLIEGASAADIPQADAAPAKRGRKAN